MLAGATLPERLQRAAAAHPDRPAVSVHDGAVLTFASWQRRSEALARGLRRRGVAPGDRVALRFDGTRWADFAVACLAVHKATAVAVPVGAGLADLEQQRVLDHAEPAALLAPPELTPTDLRVATHAPEELEAEGADQPLNAPADADDLAEVCYRSRPLSQPAPVARSHRSLLGSPWASLALGGTAGSLIHPFRLGTVEGQDALWTALGSQPVAVTALEAFDLADLGAALAAATPAACALHPAAAAALLDAGAASHRDLAPVSALILSSAPVTGRLLVRLATALPQATLHLIDVLSDPGAARDAFTHDRHRPGALGRPLTSTPVWAADGLGRPVDRGELGWLWLRDPAAASGQHTGAVGYTDEAGAVYTVAGRTETVRRPGGPTRSRTEIEGALWAHPDVADAVVLGSPQDHRADELVAAVVPRPAASTPDPTELRAVVADRLGPDKSPDTVALIEEVPRNQAGVILRDRLRQQLGLPSPGDDAAEPPPADDDVEASLTRMWRRVLGVEDIGRQQGFFELGGGWADAATLLNLVTGAFGVRVPLGAFLTAPTVAGLATDVRQRRASDDDLAGGLPGRQRGEPEEGSEPDEGSEPRRAPIAFSQQGMLWHERFAPGCQNLPGLARRFRGPLDLEALERALDEVVRRQEALRTTFEVRDGEPVQIVAPHRPRPLPVQDLSHLAAGERDRRVQQLIGDAGARPIDLVRGPLFEASVLRLDDQDHVLLIRTHHSVFDDWSVSVFRHELSTLYAAHTEGHPSPLPEPPMSFADFSQDQHRKLAGSQGARQLAFWRQELAGAPLATQLPVDDPNRPEGSPQPAGEPVSITLPGEVRAELHRLARTERATLFMAMLAAFGVLVHRYTGQDDLVLATVVAHRNRTELEGLIGCFTKKVPLRLQLGDDPTFSEALARTRKALLGALGHQDLAFEDIVQDVLGPPAAAHGLVPHPAVMFQGVTPQQDLDVPGVDSAGFETSSTTTRAHFMAGDDEPGGPGRDAGSSPPDERDGAPTSDVTGSPPWGDGLYLGTFLILSVNDSGEDLSCLARGAFHAPAVRGLLARLRTLLTDLAADPGRPVSELALLDADARDAIVARQPGPSPASPDRTLLGALHHQVAQRADAVAISTATEAVTYAELDARSTRLAWRLRAAGVRRGDRVGLALRPSPELLMAALAAWKAGAAWLALDPGETDERLVQIVEEATPTAVVSTTEHAHLSHHVAVLGPEPDAANRPAAEDEDRGAPAGIGIGDEAVVIRGGAPPPGEAVLAHETVVDLAARLGHAGDDDGAQLTAGVALCGAAIDEGFLRHVIRLLAGQRLHIPDGPRQDEPGHTVRLVETGTVDVVDCTPEELDALEQAGLAEALGHRRSEWPEPRLVIGARGPVGPDRWRTLRELPRARVMVLYGPPECAFAATTPTHGGAEQRIDAGSLLPGISAHVLDAHGRPVPDRALGELHLAGHGLARVPAQADGGTPGGAAADHAAPRLYRTGQRARRLPDGRVELLGATATDADLRGFRVDPLRVARAITGAPGVAKAAVALERDDHGIPHLVAHLTPDGPPPTVDDVRAHVRARLPGYAWPDQVVVHRDDATGPLPPADRARSAAQLAGRPLDARGHALCSAWANVLGIDHVARTDNYWQAFSFLEALARLRDSGIVLQGQLVTRHRTIGALGTSLSTCDPRSQP